MKYFTPELLHLLGSPNEDVATNAHQALERAAEAYQSQLQTIRADLPQSLRQLLEQHYLHDARVLLAGETDSGNGFILWLRLDTPPHEELILNYRMVRKPEVTQHLELAEASPLIEWLHDEVEVLRSPPGLVRQSVLLSNGWEIGLFFDAIEVTRISQLLFSSRKQGELVSKE